MNLVQKLDESSFTLTWKPCTKVRLQLIIHPSRNNRNNLYSEKLQRTEYKVQIVSAQRSGQCQSSQDFEYPRKSILICCLLCSSRTIWETTKRIQQISDFKAWKKDKVGGLSLLRSFLASFLKLKLTSPQKWGEKPRGLTLSWQAKYPNISRCLRKHIGSCLRK